MDAPVKSFIVKRINGLWLPFVKYGLLFLLLHNVFFHLNIYNDVYGYNGEVSRIYDVKDFVAKAIHIVLTMRGAVVGSILVFENIIMEFSNRVWHTAI